MLVTRLIRREDAPAIAALLQRNRDFLSPWQPRRSERFYTEGGQLEAIDAALGQHANGNSVPLVILDQDGEVAGSITIQSIIRGFFQSCSVGFWLAESAQGQGLASRALRNAADLAFGELRLHRVQAETLPENVRSQAVLERAGFVSYGTAAAYLKINERWRDCVLYQLITPNPDQVVVPQ